MSTSLLKLTEEYQEILNIASDPDTDPQLLEDTLEAIKGEIGLKIDGYAAVMKSLEYKEGLFRDESKRLKNAADRLKSNQDAMRERIKMAMEAMGVTEIEGDYNIAKIVNNGGVLPLKVDGDVPESFTKVTIEPDNAKIRKALDDGQKLGFAHYEPRGTHLKIS